MKKILVIIMAIGVMFAVCSCGKKSEAEKKPEVTTSVEEGKYEAKSNATKKVFRNNTNYLMFYYEEDGKTIKGIDTVMTFGSEDIAKSSLEVLNKNKNTNFGEMVLEGKYIVIHMSENYISDFKKMSEADLEGYLKGQGYILAEKYEEPTTVQDTKKADKDKAKEAEKTVKTD